MPKNIQFTVPIEDHKFINHLAVENDTTVADIFRAYIAYLKGEGKLIGYENTKKIIFDRDTLEIRIPLKGSGADDETKSSKP